MVAGKTTGVAVKTTGCKSAGDDHKIIYRPELMASHYLVTAAPTNGCLLTGITPFAVNDTPTGFRQGNPLHPKAKSRVIPTATLQT